METYIGKVKDRFIIRGRGVVVVTDQMTEALVGLVKEGDTVELRNGTAKPVRAVIKDVAAMSGKDGHPFAFLTDASLTREQAATGAEIWVVA